MPVSQINAEFWSILWRSLQVSGSAVLISALLGIPLGVWFGLLKGRWRSVIGPIIYTGMALPPVVVGLVLYIVLSRSGPLWFLDWLYTPKAMILAQTLLAVPFVVGIVMTAVAAVPRELALQIRSLGASRWQTRWTILREARPGVILAVATAFGRSISEVGAVLIVGGDIKGHTRVLTTAIALETGKGEFAFALSLGAALLMMALLVNTLVLRMQGRPPAS